MGQLKVIEKDFYKIFNGNCYEVMPEIPMNSVDFILVDLPYSVTEYAWDQLLDMEVLWRNWWRLLKRNRAVALTATEPFATHLKLSNLKDFRYPWYWKKTKVGNIMNAKNSPLRVVEQVIMFSKGVCANNNDNRMFYNPQGIIRVNKECKNSPEARVGACFATRPSHQDTYVQEYTNYPTDVLEFPNESWESINGTQKPLALLEYLIRTYTNEGETVLDCCMGSGSTGVACKNTGRKFIGIELRPEQFEEAHQNLENFTGQTKKAKEKEEVKTNPNQKSIFDYFG